MGEIGCKASTVSRFIVREVGGDSGPTVVLRGAGVHGRDIEVPVSMEVARFLGQHLYQEIRVEMHFVADGIQTKGGAHG